MSPPIRPRPIIPSCIYASSEVDARDAAAALLQRREVARRLRADQLPEAERLARDRELVARVVDDLQEEARSAGRPCAAGRSSAGSAGRSRA